MNNNELERLNRSIRHEQLRCARLEGENHILTRILEELLKIDIIPKLKYFNPPEQDETK